MPINICTPDHSCPPALVARLITVSMLVNSLLILEHRLIENLQMTEPTVQLLATILQSTLRITPRKQ